VLTKACVLRSGGDFAPEHAQWLARQVPGLVCLTDMHVSGMPTLPLQHAWPKWWAKLEMFGPSLRGDVLMLDLDTVVLRMPEVADRGRSIVLKDFGQPHLIGSGFMYVTESDRRRVWADFTRDPQTVIDTHRKWPKHGDQGYLLQHMHGARRWQDVAKVLSFKTHCETGLPAGAEVVCFHGQPRPWQVDRTWIPKL
jgi:hypothetical protein